MPENNQDDTQKTEDEHVGYFAYAGKRFINEKLVYAYIETDERGHKILPKEASYFWRKKFDYAKRPNVGHYYKVRFTDAERSRYYTDPNWKAHQGIIPDSKLRADYELSHKVSVLSYDMMKSSKKAMNTDNMPSITLGEFRANLHNSTSAKERRMLITILLDYLHI